MSNTEAAREAGTAQQAPAAGSYFTLVFEGDLRKFALSPFKTDTPFGRPVAAGIGDAFAEIEELHDALDQASRQP